MLKICQIDFCPCCYSLCTKLKELPKPPYGPSCTNLIIREIADDLKHFLEETNADLEQEEVQQIADNMRLVGVETDFATLHQVYGWMVDGVNLTPKSGVTRNVPLIYLSLF